MIRVLIVDDHEFVRAMVARVLADAEGIRVVGEAADGSEVLDAVEATRSDPAADSDADGLTNYFEASIGSNPTLADSDLDGLIDSFEASIGTNARLMDTDLDGFTDGMEVRFGTNPLVADATSMGAPLGQTLPAPSDPAVFPDHDLPQDSDVQ